MRGGSSLPKDAWGAPGNTCHASGPLGNGRAFEAASSSGPLGPVIGAGVFQCGGGVESTVAKRGGGAAPSLVGWGDEDRRGGDTAPADQEAWHFAAAESGGGLRCLSRRAALLPTGVGRWGDHYDDVAGVAWEAPADASACSPTVWDTACRVYVEPARDRESLAQARSPRAEGSSLAHGSPMASASGLQQFRGWHTSDGLVLALPGQSPRREAALTARLGGRPGRLSCCAGPGPVGAWRAS